MYGCKTVADSANILSTGKFPLRTLQCEIILVTFPHSESFFIFAESVKVFVKSLQKCPDSELAVFWCLYENCIFSHMFATTCKQTNKHKLLSLAQWLFEPSTSQKTEHKPRWGCRLSPWWGNTEAWVPFVTSQTATSISSGSLTYRAQCSVTAWTCLIHMYMCRMSAEGLDDITAAGFSGLRERVQGQMIAWAGSGSVSFNINEPVWPNKVCVCVCGGQN